MISSLEQLSDRFNQKANTMIVLGDLTRDEFTLEKMLNENISKGDIFLLMIAPNDNQSYPEYLRFMSTKFGIGNFELLVANEIVQVHPILNDVKPPAHLAHIRTLPNYFLILFSLAIARTEAIGADKIWVPLSAEDLTDITPNASEFIASLRHLAQVGANYLKNIQLHFPAVRHSDNMAIEKRSHHIESNKALIMYSGGLDCNAALYILKALGKEIALFNVKYGQSNRFQEHYCVTKSLEIIRDSTSIQLETIQLECLSKIGGSLLLNDQLDLVQDNAKYEYVPFRNTILINMGIVGAIKNECKYLVTGGHHDDNLSPDNNLIYYNAFQQVLNLQYWTKNIVLYPVLLYLGGKCELIYVAEKLGLHFEYCWSCNNHTPKDEVGKNARACGTCGNCSTRYHAFKRVSLKDPLEYKTTPHLRNKWSGWADGSSEILSALGVEKKEF